MPVDFFCASIFCWKYFCCKLVKSMYKCMCALLRACLFLSDLSIIADNVSGGVETSAYASEYSKYNCFLFEVFTFLKFFLMA